MECFVYKWRIFFGGIASASLLAGGVAGPALASVTSGQADQVVSSAPGNAPSSVLGVVQPNSALEALPLAGLGDAAGGLPVLGDASGGLPVLGNAGGSLPVLNNAGGSLPVLNNATGIASQPGVIDGNSAQAMTNALAGMPAAIPGVGAVTGDPAASLNGANSPLGSITGNLGGVPNDVPDLSSDASDTVHGLDVVTGVLSGLAK
jgi:hypothetical protein